MNQPDTHAFRERYESTKPEFLAKSRELARRTAGARARAHDPRNQVEVEVAQGGVLRDLHIDRAAYRTYPPEALAALILDLAATANAQLSERITAEYVKVFGIAASPEKLRSGGATATDLAESARLKYFGTARSDTP